jgi:hypothetical protein
MEDRFRVQLRAREIMNHIRKMNRPVHNNNNKNNNTNNNNNNNKQQQQQTTTTTTNAFMRPMHTKEKIQGIAEP